MSPPNGEGSDSGDRSARPGDCPTHGGLSEELEALATLLAERLESWSERVRQDEPAAGTTESGASRARCPICCVLDLLRGQRPELAARLTEHGVGLLAAAREALNPPDAGGQYRQPGPEPGPSSGPDKPVQQVPVRRSGQRRQADP